jgi:glycosyltransferase involved in cell wall biosynthesis
MRILYVAMAGSVHVARYLSQVNDRGWDLHLFDSGDQNGCGHPLLQRVTLHGCLHWPRPEEIDASVSAVGFWPLPRGSRVANLFARRFLNTSQIAPRKLARLIDDLRPDVIHTHEIQHGGYLMLRASKYLNRALPPWIVTNWGSDIYFFGRLKNHQAEIRAVLSTCQYYSCETARDVPLARRFGFHGEVLLPVMPNPGGFRFEETEPLRQPGPTSKRRLILVKGYQGLFGRALTALRALELCRDLLRDYKIVVYSAGDDLRMAAEVLANSTQLEIEVIPHTHNYQDMLRLRGQARISIGLSVSDAASISFLEALVMGAFPIQSDTGAAHEWIKDGEGGFIVHPEEPQQVAQALRRALTDDDLVDSAVAKNDRVARARLDFYDLREKVVAWYEKIAATISPVCGQIHKSEQALQKCLRRVA